MRKEDAFNKMQAIKKGCIITALYQSIGDGGTQQNNITPCILMKYKYFKTSCTTICTTSFKYHVTEEVDKKIQTFDK